jgi:hypothetical protein
MFAGPLRGLGAAEILTVPTGRIGRALIVLLGFDGGDDIDGTWKCSAVCGMARFRPRAAIS